jgi:hypothetical protein
MYAVLLFHPVCAGIAPQTATAHRGAAPVIDGVMATGEWSDADSFHGMEGWNDECGGTPDQDDQSIAVYIKHDGSSLYFCFDVTDDTIYSVDTQRWTPNGFPESIHGISVEGWAWYGDAVELMMSPSNDSLSTSKPAGNSQSWQVVVNSGKSIPGGLGTPGLSGGEPRAEGWETYNGWISSGAMEAAVGYKGHEEDRGYVIEWKISADPCLEVSPGEYANLTDDTVSLGMNIECEDLDTRDEGCYAGIDHITNWVTLPKSQIKNWGNLHVFPEPAATHIVKRSGMRAPGPRTRIVRSPRSSFEMTIDTPESFTISLLSLRGSTRRTWRGHGSGACLIPAAEMTPGAYLVSITTAQGFSGSQIRIVR